MKNSGLIARARYSAAGLGDAWRRERSFRTHIAFAAALIGLLIYLRPEAVWWAILLLALGVGMACETMNGALEALTDVVEPRRDPRVRVVKDMASAAAFLVNLVTMLIASLLMVTHLQLF